MAEAPQEGVGEPAVPVEDNMTAGERFDTAFGSNDPARRESTVEQEPEQPQESFRTRIKNFFRIGQKPQA